MNTTTTEQGVRCGNHGKDRVYHADRNAVRACFAGRTAAQPAAPSQPANHFEAAIASEWDAPTTPRNADEARSASMQRLVNQTSPFFQDRNMGRPATSTFDRFPASEGRVRLITSLVEEHLTRPEDKAMAEGIVGLLAQGMGSDTAKATIEALLKLKAARRAEPQQEAPRTTGTKRASAELMTQLMGERTERNFAIIDEDGKARFYRVSKRGKRSSRPGTWKIQERVSDSLFPRYDSMLASVGAAIMAQGGAEAAGRRFAELMHRCYECGASLTDTTGNPYYSIGLGPECGSK